MYKALIIEDDQPGKGTTFTFQLPVINVA